MPLVVRALTKRYAGVTVLDRVDLNVDDGEIHALLGPNGAGKSTLIKCVSGAVRPDDGEIRVNDETFRGLSPQTGLAAGVAVIYQDLSVVDTLSVADNVFLGSELRRGPLLRVGATRTAAGSWIRGLGLDLSPNAIVGSLSSGERQVVEIAKALRRDPKLLILDEPTAALTEGEARLLMERMRTLRAHGLPIVFVTHRLAEVFEVADRVTVLRGGRVALSKRVSETTREELVAAISTAATATGGADASAAPSRSARPSGVRLRVTGLLGPGLGPVSFDASAGEVLGLYGVVGSGRTELLETIAGVRRAAAGEIHLDGERVGNRGIAGAISTGIALVPSDRLRAGLVREMRADENVLLPSFSGLAAWRVLRRRRDEDAFFDSAASTLRLDPPDPVREAARFSGGNQQKLVLGRWLQRRDSCHVLLLDEPTNGVDVGARADLYRAIREFTVGGRVVLMASSEPEEILAVADRVLVLSRGRVSAQAPTVELTEEALVRLAHFGEDGARTDVSAATILV